MNNSGDKFEALWNIAKEMSGESSKVCMEIFLNLVEACNTNKDIVPKPLKEKILSLCVPFPNSSN